MIWGKEKPIFTEDCTLVTATYVRGNLHYDVWRIERVNHGDGWYWAWLQGDGEEFGDIADLSAHYYCIIPPVNPNKL